MKNKKKLFICLLPAVCLIITVLAVFSSFNWDKPAGSQDTLVITENKIGTFDGWDYELWKDEGNTRMVVSGSGKYECEWHDTHDVVFRTGRKFYLTKSLKSFGKIDLNYGADYRPDGNSFLSVYGWMKNPLVEFYIVENWGKTRPDDKQQIFEERTYLGTYTVNDAEYDVYSSLRENKPSIEGNETTFTQYWSIRRTPSSEGTIFISDHFRIWDSLELPLGDIYEISFAVEGIQSSGYAEVYLNELSWDGKTGQ